MSAVSRSRCVAARVTAFAAAALVTAAACPAPAGAWPTDDVVGADPPASSSAGLGGDSDWTAWILSTVTDDGAIATSPDQRLVWPYFSNFAAMGLAAASGPSRRAAHEAAWRWVEWYARHQRPNGCVNDHQRAAGALVDTGTVDSTDATSATFLMAVHRISVAAPNRARLEAMVPGVERAIECIGSTQDRDGLTWARPDEPVKYLMDNVEVRVGLDAAALVLDSVRRPFPAIAARVRASMVRSGIESMWNPIRRNYDWAEFRDGTRSPSDTRRFYADATAQMWAVAFGAVGLDRARALVADFVGEHPDWADPSKPIQLGPRTRRSGYWPLIAWAIADADPTAAAVARTGLGVGAFRAGGAWPFTSAIAGQLMMDDPAALARPVDLTVRRRGNR